MGQYRFDRYKTVDRKAPPANPVTIISSDAGSAEALWKSRHSALADGVSLSRDLAAEPANVIYPETFVERVRAAFGNTANVKIEVLDSHLTRGKTSSM